MRITPLKVAFFLLFLAVVLWVAGYIRAGNSCPVTYKTETVNGSSLAGFIENGTEVQVALGYYACNPLERDEVVIYQGAQDKNPIIKMARAVGGDTFALALSEGGAKIVINGEVIKTTTGEPYRLPEKAYQLLSRYERDYWGVIPAGGLLLLGNIPGGSGDSTQFGFVSTDNLLGKVVKVMPTH